MQRNTEQHFLINISGELNIYLILTLFLLLYVVRLPRVYNTLWQTDSKTAGVECCYVICTPQKPNLTYSARLTGIESAGLPSSVIVLDRPVWRENPLHSQSQTRSHYPVSLPHWPYSALNQVRLSHLSKDRRYAF